MATEAVNDGDGEDEVLADGKKLLDRCKFPSLQLFWSSGRYVQSLR